MAQDDEQEQEQEQAPATPEEERIMLRHSELVDLVNQAVEAALAARATEKDLEDRKLAEVDELARQQEAHSAEVLAQMGVVTIYPEESVTVWWNGHPCELIGGEPNIVPAVFSGVYQDHLAQQHAADSLKEAMIADYRNKAANPGLIPVYK